MLLIVYAFLLQDNYDSETLGEKRTKNLRFAMQYLKQFYKPTKLVPRYQDR